MYEGILKKYSLFLLLLCYMAPILYAQSDDFTTWTTMKVSHKFTSHFTMTGKMELRTKDSMKTMDRWGTSLSGSYQLFPFLKAEGGYELHHRDRGIEGWKYRHRYNLGVTGKCEVATDEVFTQRAFSTDLFGWKCRKSITFPVKSRL